MTGSTLALALLQAVPLVPLFMRKRLNCFVVRARLRRSRGCRLAKMRTRTSSGRVGKSESRPRLRGRLFALPLSLEVLLPSDVPAVLRARLRLGGGS